MKTMSETSRQSIYSILLVKQEILLNKQNERIRDEFTEEFCLNCCISAISPSWFTLKSKKKRLRLESGLDNE